MIEDWQLNPEFEKGCPACKGEGPDHWESCSMVTWTEPNPGIATPPHWRRVSASGSNEGPEDSAT